MNQQQRRNAVNAGAWLLLAGLIAWNAVAGNWDDLLWMLATIPVLLALLIGIDWWVKRGKP